MNPDDFIQAAGAIAVALAGLGMAYQRYGVLRTKDRTAQSGEYAIQAQFKTLKGAIDANREEVAQARAEAALARTETAELRHEQARTDVIIHKQQRTLTRMELLLRQFAALIQERGGRGVPPHMQAELDSILLDNETIFNRGT